MLKNDTGDPFETQALISAIAFYRLSTHIISDDSISKLIEECQQVVQKNNNFKD
jgi:hypothetical protein